MRCIGKHEFVLWVWHAVRAATACGACGHKNVRQGSTHGGKAALLSMHKTTKRPRHTATSAGTV